MGKSQVQSEPTASAPLATAEVRRCAEVLRAIADDRALLAGVPEELRRELLTAAGRISRPSTHAEKRLVKEFRRAGRRRKQALDRGALSGAAIRAAREAPVFVPPPRLALPAGTADGPELQSPRNCYTCKAEYRRVHFFYDALCPACAEFNYAKRFQTAELSGRVALVTGGRVKIGFQTALKFLRAGARVLVTTRFPRDAAGRFAAEEDFGAWRGRLAVYGLDLRHAPSVELFARYLGRTLGRLDILVNNACQTVRRPPGFYAHLLEGEARAIAELPADRRALLEGYESLLGALGGGLARLPAGESAGAALAAPGGAAYLGLGLRAPAALSQVRLAYEDRECGGGLFPAGRTDADLQQVDLRAVNSWRLSLHEISTPELLEVHLVNAVAPFILCARLKGLLLRAPGAWRHVVNVSAMEGVFSRGTKTEKHPHTNMAKAALNMLTLTSAREYAREGIFMNAVDTGWVTDEDPAEHARRKREELGFQPPLDIVDGAARLCDPVFTSALGGEHLWGKFLKDYRPSAW